MDGESIEDAIRRQIQTREIAAGKKESEAQSRSYTGGKDPFEGLSEDDQYNVFKLYKLGVDKLVNMGLARAHGRHMIVRGLTDTEIRTGAREDIALGGDSGDDIRKASVFEIRGLGDEVPATFMKGHHCVPVSAALDPLRADYKTRYALVHMDDVPVSWSVKDLADQLRDHPESATNLRLRANGIID